MGIVSNTPAAGPYSLRFEAFDPRRPNAGCGHRHVDYSASCDCGYRQWGDGFDVRIVAAREPRLPLFEDLPCK